MSEPQRVRGSYRWQVSNGNFGNETAEASVERDLEPDEDYGVAVAFLLQDMRARVQAELARSPSDAVRRALEPPKPPRPRPAPVGPPADDAYDEDLPFDER